jgi:hypothetical protein
MIYFLCPDYEEPAGGIMMIYRQTEILNQAGIPATVLHEKAPFRCGWFENNTVVTWRDRETPGAADIAVMPEIMGPAIDTLYPETPKVIFNQNTYNTFDAFPIDFTGGYPYRNALTTLVVSDDNRNYIRCIFPGMPVYRIRYAIDPDLFYYDPALKQEQWAIMPRKNTPEIFQVLHGLRARGFAMHIAFLDGLSRRETAKRLRESKYFLSFGHPEGFGLPPAEAMACGCITIGFHGRGGAEFFREPCAWPVDFGDIPRYIRTIQAVAEKDLHDQAAAAAAFIRENYSPEKERDSILTAWRTILAAREG